MNLNLKLRHKMQLITISISAIVFMGAIAYISIKAKQTAYRDATKLVEFQAGKSANKIEALLNSDFSVVRTLANAFENYDYLPKEKWQNLIRKMYIDVYQANPSFYNLWDSWELKHIDSTWDQPYGRISNQNFMENKILKTPTDRRSLDGDPNLYASWKSRSEELVAEIYADVFTEHKEGKKLMTTLAAPIKQSGEFIGLVGVDITLDRFQEILREIQLKNLEGCRAFLLTHQAKYAAHSNKNLLNQKAEKNPTENEDFNLYKRMRKGKPFSIIHRADEIEETSERYVAYAPLTVGNTDTQWFLAISVPIGSIKAEAGQNFVISLIVGFIGLIILGFVIHFFSGKISAPIGKVTERLNKLARGHINNNMKLQLETGDELEEMANALNTSIEALNNKNEFARKLGNGELETGYEMLSDEDQLGKSLIHMRDSLSKAREEEEKRKAEDEKRQWVNEGLAKFADILRQNNDDLEKLSYEIVRNLVDYLNANQGGLFLLNDEDEHNVFYELKAAYAFNRKKYLEKQFKTGEGLIGTCAIEKKTIYMTEIPRDYIQLQSGLGDANPNSLLIVPLKIEEDVLGVVEIASLNQLEDYQVEFAEKVAESIASTLSSVRVNLRTSQLLEKSRQQAEEMSSQEEEMRQNMEELKATQEEAARRENELMGIVEAIDQFLIKAEMDKKGAIISTNSLFQEIFGYEEEEINKINIDSILHEEELKRFRDIWEKVCHGGHHKQKMKCKSKSGDSLWVVATFSPVKDKDDTINKILFIGMDHTNSENEKLELQEKLENNK